MRDRLSSFSLAFFDSWLASGALALFLLIGGILSYTSWLPREGFPPIQFPLTIVQSTYFAEAAEVDEQVAQPLQRELSNVEGVERIDATINNNSASTLVYFDESVSADEGTEDIRARIDGLDLPPTAEVSTSTINPAAFLNEYDVLVSVYPEAGGLSERQLQDYAEVAAKKLGEDSRLSKVEVVPLFSEDINPQSGQSQEVQTSFSQIGLRDGDGEQLEFYSAVTIGVSKTDALDVIELSEAVTNRLNELEDDSQLSKVNFVIGSDFAESITTQIDSLESNLLTGILAVAAVSLLLITWRASIVTSIFMGTVMMATMLVLLLVGYTLNTITLFGLVLALGLFVDDATIIVEAIDANNGSKTSTREAVKRAIKKVGPASIAGTLTTVFVFLPIAFVGGVLGEFIRLLPITVIIALLSSLLLSLSLIPFLARFSLSSRKYTPRLLGGSIDRLARFVAAGPRTLKKSRAKGLAVALTSVLLSLVMMAGSVILARSTSFNIFPTADDSDQVQIAMSFPAGTTLEQAQNRADEVNTIVAQTIGRDAERAVYGGFTPPSARGADVVVNLRPFSQRETTSQQYIERLEQAFTQVEDVTTNVSQIDGGPPATDYPFKAQVYTADEVVASSVLTDMQSYLEETTITAANGEDVVIADVRISNTDTIRRRDGEQFFQIEAAYESAETSSLVQATQTELESEFSSEKLNEYGLSGDDVTYDFGQESENAESFSALGQVFPIAIGAILILLAIQFRSLLQPLLIILAIPFSLFGVFGGLILTGNALSFFSMVGLIGLIGIAVNNTILLTDYANQERAKGESLIEATSLATEKRFRPLITTTLTTIVALLPLALTDPFWEPLAYTIIFGLASSTLLVVVAFPYYYLLLTKIGEYLKGRTLYLRR